MIGKNNRQAAATRSRWAQQDTDRAARTVRAREDQRRAEAERKRLDRIAAEAKDETDAAMARYQ